MSAALLQAKDHTQLVAQADADGRYLFQHIFQDSGMFSKRRLDRKFRIVKGVDEYLGKILEADEKVFHVTQGVLNSYVEQFFLGWVMNIINRKAFIFTSKRLILIQLKGKEKPAELKTVIRYASIRNLKRSWNGLLKIELHDGKTYSFLGVPKQDRKFISTTIQGLIERTGTEPSREGQVNLCPECGARVDGFPPSCAVCSKPFKNAAKAAWLSLIFPGLGDFYLGHRGLATLEILGTALVWVSVFLPDENGFPSGTEVAFTAAVLFVLVHGVDALVTRHIARKGIYPA